MLLIRCPWCGFRDQSEFQAQGEAHITRPEDPYQLDEEQWGQYLFFRKNPKGVHYERWVHVHGCRRWFNVVRNTMTDDILATYRPEEPIPVLSDEETNQPT
ncbi:MAG: sarcosine oxidase subunit delta [Gammaproteobacteria bacterium]|nr:sarcosine oxidase subunit delta [Gammaproteobacteria bacterium]MCY4218962.1 sarcosine oxidase subunit delta [Gammaproteobacteria bacterium]MCY4275292.1 sarcosine oxidase subunit delta [Gammaproteobacteria bacterium]